ncbi:D-alanyl-D-alanine carboxypeptidase family protein [Peptococcaceae bacterium 1198_IL3148]
MKLRIKQIFISIVLMVSLITQALCPTVSEGAEPQITADAAILMDAKTGQIFYAKNPDKQRAPASLTKIMTAILAIELGNLDEVVTVGERAQNIYIGQQIDLQAGEKIKLAELVKAALLYSANDSTVAIAEHVGGSHDHFVQLMNQKALALGLLDTRFVNTNGYSVPNHYSTAYDLALLTKYALNNPTFAQIVKTKETTIHWVDSQRTRNIKNTNKLLQNDYPGVDGVKTGTTSRAGNCVIASATRNNQQLIAVVLHSRNRFKDAEKLLEYGFNDFAEQTAVAGGQVFGDITVGNGVMSHVKLVAAQDLSVQVPKEDGNVSLQVHVPGKVTAPVTKGQQLGYVSVSFDGRDMGQVPLVAQQTIKAQTRLHKFWYRLTD